MYAALYRVPYDDFVIWFYDALEAFSCIKPNSMVSFRSSHVHAPDYAHVESLNFIVDRSTYISLQHQVKTPPIYESFTGASMRCAT